MSLTIGLQKALWLLTREVTVWLIKQNKPAGLYREEAIEIFNSAYVKLDDNQ
jgi:hypothetical protein